MTGRRRAAILVVDDDPYTRSLLDGLLGDRYALTFAADGTEARSSFRNGDFNLIIMDQRLPGDDGLTILGEMRTQRPRQVALLITGYASIPEAVKAVREGLFDYLTKPFDNLDELEAVVEKALELDRAYREIDLLRNSLEPRQGGDLPIGRSPKFKRLMEQIRQVAPLDTTVLVEGESGTGKELVAGLLHGLGPRSSGPWVEINCGALSETLLESTLFGYEKGAFTDAFKTTRGCFEAADGGTLFLDEIAAMSPKLQSSLLRVLQERTFARLGATGQRESDFRLICATNSPLQEEVRAGRFREDLYYRIHVIHLRIPPLRERHGDAALLATHFLEHFNRKFGKTVGPLTPDSLEAIERHGWPGNVRELEHAVERIVALKPDGPVTAADFAQSAPDDSATPPDDDTVPLHYGEAREGFDREYLRRLLATAHGNVSEAARLSGISRQNLHVKIRKLGL